MEILSGLATGGFRECLFGPLVSRRSSVFLRWSGQFGKAACFSEGFSNFFVSVRFAICVGPWCALSPARISFEASWARLRCVSRTCEERLSDAAKAGARSMHAVPSGRFQQRSQRKDLCAVSHRISADKRRSASAISPLQERETHRF